MNLDDIEAKLRDGGYPSQLVLLEMVAEIRRLRARVSSLESGAVRLISAWDGKPVVPSGLPFFDSILALRDLIEQPGIDFVDDEDPGTCLKCSAPFELVRPGKSQPTCSCWDDEEARIEPPTDNHGEKR